jgi:hypothetical protein
LTRRTFLGGLSAGAIAWGASGLRGPIPAIAQSTGPRVFVIREDRLGRIFPNLRPFADSSPRLLAALREMGRPGGLLDAGDNLAAGRASTGRRRRHIARGHAAQQAHRHEDLHTAVQPAPGDDRLGDPRTALPQRNLLRHVTWLLPSGQSIARGLAVPAPSKDDLRELRQFGKNLDESTPLWYYVLKEAHVMANGLPLGPVGGRIVGEVFIGLLRSTVIRISRSVAGGRRCRPGVVGSPGTSRWWTSSPSPESTPRTEASRPDRSFRLSRFSAGPGGERVLAAAVPAETPAIRRPPASPPLAGARRRRMLCFES